jgi:hypothetical protein
MIDLNEMDKYELLDERESAMNTIRAIRMLESTSQAQQDKLIKPLQKIVVACEKELDGRF